MPLRLGQEVQEVPRGLTRLAESGNGARGDATQVLVRERGMSVGWVDYKVASLDETWSARVLPPRLGSPQMAETTQTVDERLEEIGAQLAWVRDYL